MTKRIRLLVSGFVHGVGFRMFIHRTARELNLSGWVRNLPDGTVEIEAQGTEEMITELLRQTEKGPSRSRVTSIRKEELEPHRELDRFTVIM